MNIYTKKGHKVRLATIDNGRQYEREMIKQHLLLNNTYTVEHTDVYGSHTNVYLQEVPGVAFNSVFFSDVEPQSQVDNEKHKDYGRYH